MKVHSLPRAFWTANRAIFGLTLAAMGVGLWIWTPLPPGLWHDDGVYLLLGKSLANGHGLLYDGVPGTPRAPHFPPGYPAVVAIAWLIGKDALGAARVAALFNVLFIGAAVGLTAAYATRALRLPLSLGIGVGAVAAVSVDFWRPALVALSEPLYVLLMLAALLAAFLAERDDARPRDYAILSVLLIVLMYVRTAGVTVVAAAVLGLAIRRRWRAAAAVGVSVAVAMIPWVLWSRSAGEAIPGPLLDILGSYGSWLKNQVAASPLGYLKALPGNALAVGLSVFDLVVPQAHPLLWTIAVLPVVVALVAGTISLANRSPVAALTLVGSVVLAVLWPFQDRRLVMPILPLLLLGLACLAERLRCDWKTAGPGAKRWLPGFALGGLTVWAVAFFAVSLVRLGLGWAPAGYEERAKLLSSSLETMRGNVPTNAVVGSPELWSAIPLMLPLRAVPSARFQPMETTGRPIWGTPEQQYRLWAVAGVDFLLVEDLLVHQEALDALDVACPGAVKLVDSRPGVFLVQLAWDAACKQTVGAEG